MDYGIMVGLFWMMLLASGVLFLVVLVRSVQVRRLRRKVRELEWYQQFIGSRHHSSW